MKYLFTFIVSLLIVIAVLLPGSSIPEVNFIGVDKIVHVGMFGAWAMAVYFDFNVGGTIQYLKAFGAGVIFSLFTEVVQIFIEGRTFDWSDMIADAFGLLAGLTIGGWIIRRIKARLAS